MSENKDQELNATLYSYLHDHLIEYYHACNEATKISISVNDMISGINQINHGRSLKVPVPEEAWNSLMANKLNELLDYFEKSKVSPVLISDKVKSLRSEMVTSEQEVYKHFRENGDGSISNAYDNNQMSFTDMAAMLSLQYLGFLQDLNDGEMEELKSLVASKLSELGIDMDVHSYVLKFIEEQGFSNLHSASPFLTLQKVINLDIALNSDNLKILTKINTILSYL